MGLGGGQRGFSLIEAVVATALVLFLLSSVFKFANPAEGAFAVQTEGADMQQRHRAAFDALQRDLGQAGASAAIQRGGDSLSVLAPAVLPMRVGMRGSDPPGTFRADAITVLAAAPLPAVQTRLAQPMPAQTDVARVRFNPGTPACPPVDPVCGLVQDTDVLIADGEGSFDLFTVVDVTPPLMQLRHNSTDWPKVYPAGSALSPVVSRTYFLRAGNAARPSQLVRYDGGSGPDVPVVDHVVGLSFEYFGDPEPPRMLRPLSDPIGPWTSYGPRPPVADATVVPSVAGSNCLFSENGSPLAAPRLASFGLPEAALVPLSPGELADGPWCPDDTAPNRYDADLFRIRSVLVTVRLESALDALRGPAGVLFSRAGTARAADRYAPDVTLRARVTPANLMGRR